MDAGRGLFLRQPKRLSHTAGYSRGCKVFIQHLSATKEIRGVQVPQDQVGVGYGGVVAAFAVAGGTRVGSGAVGANLQDAAGVHAGDTSPAGTQRFDVNHGHGYLPAGLGAFRRQPWRAVLNDGNICAGSAHVQADYVGLTHQLTVVRGAADSSGRPGENSPGRHAARLLY